MYKRILSLLLVAALALATLSGCGKSGNLTQETTSTVSSTIESSQKSEERELYEFTLMQDFTPVEIPPASKIFFENIEKKFNVKINFQVPASGNYNEALQIMLAGGDYPEAVLWPDITNQAFQDAVANDLVLPITKELNEYGKNIIKYSYPISLDALKVKGNDDIYGIPRTSIVRADGMFYRKDWAEALGMTLPEEGSAITLDQFTDMMRRFTKDDPDGNGVDDTFGFALSSANGVLNIPVTVAWSFGLCGWQEIDGKYVDLQYSKEHDNFKRALAYTHQLWAEKLVDPDWPNLTAEVTKQRLFAGTYGMQNCFPGHLADFQAEMQKVNPKAEITYLQGIMNENGKVQGGSYSTGLWGFTSIMKGTKHPERIVEIYDYLLSDEGWTETVYGPENVSWKYDENNNMVLIEGESALSSWSRNLVRRCDSPSFFVGLNVPVERRQRVLDLIQGAIDNNVFSLNAGFVAPVTREMSYIDYLSELDKVITKIIVGDLPVDAWDEALDGFYKAGYDKFVEQTIEYINSRKK